MSLPRQVQEQVELSERYDREFEALAREQAGEAPAEPAQAETPQEQPVAAPEVPVSEAEKPKQPADEPADVWERRYKTLKGKFDAEVPRLSSQVKELSSQLDKALSKIDSLAQQPKADLATERLVTDKDVEAYGSDLIDVIDRKAREVAQEMVNSRVSKLEAENARLLEEQDRVVERQGANDRRSYLQELGQLVPDWSAINDDPGFIGWLEEIDPLSGVARQEYLNNAYGTFDVARTATLFNAYTQATAPPPPDDTASRQLQRQVQPGTSRAAPRTTPTSADEQIISTQDIEEFYTAVRRGQYRGKEDEMAAIEAEIDKAVATGRVRQ